MTRSELALAVVDQVGDGEQGSSFVVVSGGGGGGNESAGSSRGAVDVEEVMRVLVVFEWDSRNSRRFWFDFYFCSCSFPFSCPCSCFCSYSSPFSGSNPSSDFHRTP